MGFNGFAALFRYLEKEGESAEDYRRKTVLVAFSIPVVLATTLLLGINITLFRITLIHAACAAIIIPNSFVVYYVFVKKDAPVWLVEMLATTFTVGLLLADWGAQHRVGMYRPWTAFVIAMDMLLLSNVTPHIELAVRGLASAWLVVCAVEDAYHIGLLDLFERNDLQCDCEEPPCAMGMIDAGSTLIARLVIFHVDYLLTRRFAVTMRAEQQAIKTSVETAQIIASHLAMFDLESAEEAIDEAYDLPEGLRVALRLVLGNLKTYRPYLPDACLTKGWEGEADHADDMSERLKESSSGMTSATLSSSAVVTSATATSHSLDERRVSLLAGNVRGLHAEEGSRRVEVASLFISGVAECARATKGIIDWFNGDRVLLSFNAARRNLRHAQLVVQCGLQVSRLRGVDVSVAASCGMAHCSDTGNADLKRYCVIGNVASRVHLMERLHRMWGLPGMLCDKAIEVDANCHYDICPLPGKVRFEKESRATVLWAVVGEKVFSNAGEWMYELVEGAMGHVQAYHSCLELYATGRYDEAVERCSQLKATSLGPLVAFLERTIATQRRLPYDRLTTISSVGVSDSAPDDDTLYREPRSAPPALIP